MDIKYKAKFLALAIEYGVCEKKEVIEWADEIISLSEIVPDWAIELAPGDKLKLYEMKDILSSISRDEGEMDKIPEIVKRVEARWKEKKDIALINKLLYPLTLRDDIEKNIKTQIYIVDHMAGEYLNTGFIYKKDAEREIDKLFKMFH